VRRSLTWLVTLPLAFASTIVAHDLAGNLAPLHAASHTSAFANSGSPHVAWLPYAIGALITFFAVGFVVRVLESAAGTPRSGGAGLGLAAVPLVVFVLEEHIAQLLTGSYVQLLHVSLEPRFALGLLLQLPCGLIACLIARLVLRAAEELGFRLRSRQDDPVLSLPGRPPWAAVVVDLPRVPALALGYGQRGPPSRR
jgi:hypothetical protein